MLKAMVVGASGYAGAEIVRYIHGHPHITLTALLVSDNSLDRHKLFSATNVLPRFGDPVDLPLQGIQEYIKANRTYPDIVFLATEAEVSHDLAHYFLDQNCLVCDLSGVFRLPDITLYSRYYGINHLYPELLARATYGLAEWNEVALKQATLIAVPGCYPTAAHLALRPLFEKKYVDVDCTPSIYAISGVSGAGRKANLSGNLCEAELQAYSLEQHRHEPEIAHYLQHKVLFMPHLGHFKRGIYETITVQMRSEITRRDILEIFHHYYDEKPLVRIYDDELPALKNVVGCPYCDLGFAIKGNTLIITATEDNLLKGAAAQAIQCINIHYGFKETLALI